MPGENDLYVSHDYIITYNVRSVLAKLDELADGNDLNMDYRLLLSESGFVPVVGDGYNRYRIVVKISADVVNKLFEIAYNELSFFEWNLSTEEEYNRGFKSTPIGTSHIEWKRSRMIQGTALYNHQVQDYLALHKAFYYTCDFVLPNELSQFRFMFICVLPDCLGHLNTSKDFIPYQMNFLNFGKKQRGLYYQRIAIRLFSESEILRLQKIIKAYPSEQERNNDPNFNWDDYIRYTTIRTGVWVKITKQEFLSGVSGLDSYYLDTNAEKYERACKHNRQLRQKMKRDF